ncbi:ATP-binding cassette domain-containing protein [Streptomyces diastaticus]|uniref:ATP-binding cassette domain-containing protein n=1 Tax=Streptomyces diastaticus TaxID=1956 RepID=UPI0036549ABB
MAVPGRRPPHGDGRPRGVSRRLRTGRHRATGPGGRPLVAVRDLRVPGRLSLPRLDVAAGDRLLVSGGDGTGRSTLLAVLAGRLDHGGELRRRPGLRVGLLAQDTRFRRPERTARTVYAEALGAERAEAVPLSQLGLLAAADLDRPVAELSVGQRRRLALALLVARPPELLLLDEPANHLSPSLSDELEAALDPGPGVMAGHNRWLRAWWRGARTRAGEPRLTWRERGDATHRSAVRRVGTGLRHGGGGALLTPVRTVVGRGRVRRRAGGRARLPRPRRH